MIANSGPMVSDIAQLRSCGRLRTIADGGRSSAIAFETIDSLCLVGNPGMYRPVGQHALPVPVSAPGRGVEDDLRRLVNVRREDFVLVVGFLLGTISPGPFPILLTTGPEDTSSLRRSPSPPANPARRGRDKLPHQGA